MTALEALHSFLRSEIDKGLYNYKIGSITLWNLYRMKYRYKYISEVTGVPSISKKVSVYKYFRQIVFNSYKSFICFESTIIRSE